MFGWRKRNEGFEWREYVRTTVLLRRAQRRQKMEDAKQAAVDGLKDAGKAAVAGVDGARRAAAGGLQEAKHVAAKGLRAAGQHGVSAGVAGLRAAGRGIQLGIVKLAKGSVSSAQRLRHSLGPTASRFFRSLGPALSKLKMPTISKAITAIGAVSAIAAMSRWFVHGFDTATSIAAAVAVVMLCLVLLPRAAPHGTAFLGKLLHFLSRITGDLIDRLPRPGAPVFQYAGIAVLVTVVGTAIASFAMWSGFSSGSSDSDVVTVSAAPLASSTRLRGTVVVISGDTLRLSGHRVHLAGIEAPEPDQRCTLSGNRNWSCGVAAAQALQRLVRGRIVICELSGSETFRGRLGECRVNGKDLAAELVLNGDVFSETGFFARYASIESEARKSKAGLWRGEAERPAEFRTKKWEEAKRSSPEGCPIKGHVSSGSRVYVLPWAPGYDRVQVSIDRGGRWFCTEAEAQAAGWSLSERS